MLSVLVVVSALLCLWILIYRRQVQEHKKELLWMKRHAAKYSDQRPVA
jgi:hypothetical protein